MNKAMALNADYTDNVKRYEAFVHIPYTLEGAQMVKVAWWNQETGLYVKSQLYPEKYSNFYGAELKATALHYEPYWITTQDTNNKTIYSGMDYNLLMAFCKALNFTYTIIPSKNWDEVTEQVEDRRAHFTSLAYVVLPNRYARFHFTRITTTTEYCFAMAKPVSKPSWVSFYYPLSGQVWIAVLVSTIAVTIYLVKVTGSEMWRSKHGHVNAGAVVIETIGTLLGQGLYGRVSTSQSNQGLVATWLVFGVVMSTVYRGSLIASLTLPRQPHRPETIEEFVTAVERATIEPYGNYHKSFFLKSESPVFRALGELMYVGIDVTDGLQDALTMKRAHIETREYLKLMVAKHHMDRDGMSPIYISKGKIILYTLAWPIPHDAPYKNALDSVIYSVVEAGLYEQWRKEESEKIVQDSRLKKRKEWEERIINQEKIPEDNNNDGRSDRSMSLTIIHIQGPLLLLLLGFAIGGLALVAENVYYNFRHE